jgi:UDP-N-acetylglucosamine--N-acetylmuramyl-(pentapeptide) pyrophosphoryl-undecaprenol N-acetylglucosamine transferase
LQVIVFTGGGTGGHVYPGIAVLEALRERIADVHFIWIGSKNGIERGIVEGLGIEYRAVSSGKLRRYLDWRNVTDVVRIIAGYFQSKRLLKELRPRFVFSKGGFVSVPPVRAAHRLGIPVYSHESDLDPGLATKLNLPASRAVYCAYSESVKYYPEAARSRVVVSGNPVRSGITSGNRSWLRGQWLVPEGAKVVLVLGGSLGALQVNELIRDALPALEGRVFVVHQTGRGWTAVPDSPWYVSRPYFSREMPDLYAGADLIVGRSGAGTLWEAAAAGVPLVLIPLTTGSRGDQVRNAALFEARGAASVLKIADEPRERTVQNLVGLIDAMLSDRDRRQKAITALADFGAAGAAARIAADLISRETLHV